MKKLEAATKGQYKEQFSKDRLADAIAICKHEWSHFNTSEGRLNPDKRWLPSQLASRMKHDGRRGLQSPHSQLSALAQAARSDAAILLDDVEESVPNVVQRCHFGRKLYGLSAGVPVKVVAQKILTLDEFKKRPVTLGSFVITRTAPSGKWDKKNPKLAELAFWMWNVIRVIRPGEAIPGFKNKKSLPRLSCTMLICTSPKRVELVRGVGRRFSLTIECISCGPVKRKQGTRGAN